MPDFGIRILYKQWEVDMSTNQSPPSAEVLGSWADHVMLRICGASRSYYLDESEETAILYSRLALSEDDMEEYEHDEDPPEILYSVRKELDRLGIKRTKAAEIAVTLGVETEVEAIIVSYLIGHAMKKVMPKPKKLNVDIVCMLLSGATLSKSTLNTLHIELSQLLGTDNITAQDFQ